MNYELINYELRIYDFHVGAKHSRRDLSIFRFASIGNALPKTSNRRENLSMKAKRV